MIFKLTLTYLWCSQLCFQNVFGTATPIINTNNGKLVGQIITTPKNRRIDAFLSIPFAEKQIRFQKSVMKKPWTNVLNVSEFGPHCNGASASEYCLNLKILRPSGTLSIAKHPVLFWPHGGGFTAGDIQDYDSAAQGDNFVWNGDKYGANLCSADTIEHANCVCALYFGYNHKDGALGFWSTATAANPGNWAMWDILLALQWTKQEIAAFGGDPKRIVLAGQGAGGLCSNMMSLSPLARGLYHSAFMFSASMFNPLVNIDDKVNQMRYSAFATAIGCDNAQHSLWNSNQRIIIMSCIMNKTVTQVRAAEKQIGAGTLYFHPRMDGPGGIWPYPLPMLAKQRPNIPVMMGTTHDETAWDLMVKKLLFSNGPFVVNTTALNKPQTARQECVNRITSAALANAQMAVKACQWIYVDSVIQNNQSTMGNSRQTYFWINQAVKIGSALTNHAPVATELGFYQANRNKQFTDQDKQVQAWYGDFIVRFAKYDNPAYQLGPVVTWNPVGVPTGTQHLSIDVKPVMKPYFHTSDVYFWNNLIPTLQHVNLGPSPSTTTFPQSRSAPSSTNSKGPSGTTSMNGGNSLSTTMKSPADSRHRSSIALLLASFWVFCV